MRLNSQHSKLHTPGCPRGCTYRSKEPAQSGLWRLCDTLSQPTYAPSLQYTPYAPDTHSKLCRIHITLKMELKIVRHASGSKLRRPSAKGGHSLSKGLAPDHAVERWGSKRCEPRRGEEHWRGWGCSKALLWEGVGPKRECIVLARLSLFSIAVLICICRVC